MCLPWHTRVHKATSKLQAAIGRLEPARWLPHQLSCSSPQHISSTAATHHLHAAISLVIPANACQLSSSHLSTASMPPSGCGASAPPADPPTAWRHAAECAQRTSFSSGWCCRPFACLQPGNRWLHPPCAVTQWISSLNCCRPFRPPDTTAPNSPLNSAAIARATMAPRLNPSTSGCSSSSARSSSTVEAAMPALQ